MTDLLCFMKREFYKRLLILSIWMAVLVFPLWACQSGSVVMEPNPEILENVPPGLSVHEIAALSSLEQIDDFPLYTMVYEGDLIQEGDTAAQQNYSNDPAWACSLFAAYGDLDEILYGRNFDWDFSPALLLFMYPPEGYASVSMVDIHYLGFGGERAFDITDLPLEEQVGFLDAPYLPFDGMNEAGLVVGMAAVPTGHMEQDPDKETIGSLMAIRKILDQAATIEESVEIIHNFNIDMGSTPIHYLIAERSGRSALIEFSQGEILVLLNEEPWQMATNFLMSETSTSQDISCGRYRRIEERLTDIEGKISPDQAMALLDDVAQPSTQWSVVYRVSAGEVWVAMGGKYNQVHKIDNGFD